MSCLAERDRDRVLALLTAFWQETLCLQTYDIVWQQADSTDMVCTEGEAESVAAGYCHAETRIRAGTKTAWVFYNRLMWEDPAYDLRELSITVAHELAHILYCDETALVQESMLNSLKGGDLHKGDLHKRAEDAQERMIRILEMTFARVPYPAAVDQILSRSQRRAA